jgi:predicted dehydrogenase
MKNQHRITRRSFLHGAAAGGLAAVAAPYVLTSSALGGSGRPSAGERVTIGMIGVGDHGVAQNLRGFFAQADAQVVVVCDVDAARMKSAQEMTNTRYADLARSGKFKGCDATGDWRQVVARPDVDAVMVSTPDHWHVPISLAAIRAGKDVQCEKPTLTVAEGRVLADTVKRYKAIFQLSTEDRSVAVYHRMAELVRNGRIGKLQRILVKLPSGPGGGGEYKPQPVPAGLDYDMWLGPAPYTPYHPGRLHFNFRWVRDFSGGQLTDWGAHLLDTAQWGNDTEHTGPIEVEGTGKPQPRGQIYDTYGEYHIRYRYANGVELIVDGAGVAIRFEGTNGWVGNDGWCGQLQASSDEILKSRIGSEEIRLFTCPGGEHRNFLDCFKSRRDPYFPAEIGHRCCSVMHIGNIAMDLGRKLRWDPAAERFPDDPDANLMLGRAMREPWGLLA